MRSALLYLLGLQACFVVGVYAGPVYNITFVVGATGLPKADDYSPPDAFAKLWYYKFDNKTSSSNTAEPELTRFGTTAPITNSENPEWPEVFSIQHEPGTGLKMHIEVRDHDVMNYDDVLGTTDIDVDSFVQHKGTYRAKLSSEGYITLKRTTPIKFKIRATNLPSKDRHWGSDGPSDPYVQVYSRVHRAGEDAWIGDSSTINDNNDPVWPEEFEYASYIPNQNQHLLLKLYDDDTFSADDFLGEALISCDELASKRGSVVYPLAQTSGTRSTVTIQLL